MAGSLLASEWILLKISWFTGKSPLCTFCEYSSKSLILTYNIFMLDFCLRSSSLAVVFVFSFNLLQIHLRVDLISIESFWNILKKLKHIKSANGCIHACMDTLFVDWRLRVFGWDWLMSPNKDETGLSLPRLVVWWSNGVIDLL